MNAVVFGGSFASFATSGKVTTSHATSARTATVRMRSKRLTTEERID
jgi:hypothetical protein